MPKFGPELPPSAHLRELGLCFSASIWGGGGGGEFGVCFFIPWGGGGGGGEGGGGGGCVNIIGKARGGGGEVHWVNPC